MNSLPYLSTTLKQLPRCSSTESISFPLDSLAMSSDSSYSNDEGKEQTMTKGTTQKTHHTRSHHVTTIQEYTQLVIMCMKKCKKLNTTEVAKSILSSVRPKTTKLTVNIRRRVGDALSVLTAIHLVEKQGNGYVWTGNRKSKNTSEITDLKNEVNRMKSILESKRKLYVALQKKEMELRQLSSDESQQSSELSNISPNLQYEDESYGDSNHSDFFEISSPQTSTFGNNENYDMNYSNYCPFEDSVLISSKPFPSISFPDFMFEKEKE